MAFWPLFWPGRTSWARRRVSHASWLVSPAHLGFGLRPGQRGKALRHSCFFHKVMPYVDKKLERQAESVFDQARGKKNRFHRAENRIAMADGAVTEIDRIGRSDHRFAGVGNGQRHKVIRALLQSPGKRGRHRAHQPIEVRFGNARLAPRGVVNPVRRLNRLSPAWRPSPRATAQSGQSLP